MQEIKIINEDYRTILLGWNKIDIADEYLLEGLTNIFTYETIAKTEKCSYFFEKEQKYIGYRVCYISKTGENFYIVDTTDLITPQKNSAKELTKITLIPMKSAYEEVSLSFKSEEIFDWYRLYDDKGNIIAETEDWIVLGDYSNGNYYVEGYKKSSAGYVLEGISDVTSTQNFVTISPKQTVLSIVIPVYNCSSFLPRTIQSVLSSTFTDFEIILVNDGSDKETEDLCNWYANNFSFINVIHQENQGVCIARNRGAESATGEWLAFLDSDDIVHPFMYEKLYNEAVKNSADVAISQCIARNDFEESKYIFVNQSNKPTVIMNSFKEVMDSRGSVNNIYFCAVWNKIVKTEIARKIEFDRFSRYYDDIGYTMGLYSYINKFIFVRDAYYLWDKRKRETEGTLSSAYSKISGDLLWAYYSIAYSKPLFIGNQDKEIAKVYKYDILKHLLEKYKECECAEGAKRVIGGCLKYLVREFDLPTKELKYDTNKNLSILWAEISKSNIPEYNNKKDS